MIPRLLLPVLLCACGAALGYDDLGPQAQRCAMCSVDWRLGFEFLLGCAMLGGLLWVIYWMEGASLQVVAENLLGVTTVGFVLYLFLRFLPA